MNSRKRVELHQLVVDNARQVIEHSPIRALDHLILLSRPLDLHITSDQIREPTSALSRHLQSHHPWTAFRLVGRSLLVVLGHPSAAVDEPSLLGLCLVPLLLELLRSRVVPVGVPRLEQVLDGGAVVMPPLGLVVGPEVDTDLGAFVPVDTQPSKPVEDRAERLFQIPSLVCVIDA